MHREVLKAPKGKEVDHKNRNKLDNRKENLRLCSRAENAINTPQKKGSSRYRGVKWDHTRNKWYVSLKFNGTSYFVGRFKDEDEAALAYNKEAVKLHGEFARLNEVKDEN